MNRLEHIFTCMRQLLPCVRGPLSCLLLGLAIASANEQLPSGQARGLPTMPAGDAQAGERVGSERSVWWGTPSYSYGGGTLSLEELSSKGINFMLHLVYWKNYEPQAGQYNEAFLDKLDSQVSELRQAGIASAVRLGDARPGFNVWPTSPREDYSHLEARNVDAYPAELDTDEAYFHYLKNLVSRLKGRVGFYVLGDEYDMIYHATDQHPHILRQYYDFFCKVSTLIREIDPEAKVVVYAFAWGPNVTLDSMATMTDWGLDDYASGVAVNVPYGYAYNPDYLRAFASAITDMSPDFELFANGFGYVSDEISQPAQAVRLAQLMVAMWQANWSYSPYYLPASIPKPWSSGMWVVNSAQRTVDYREASVPFRILSESLSEKPYDDSECLTLDWLSVGDVRFRPGDLVNATFEVLWSAGAEKSIGIVQLTPYSSALKFRGELRLDGAMLPDGFVPADLIAVDSVTGTALEIGARWDGDDITFECPVSAHPVLLKIRPSGA